MSALSEIRRRLSVDLQKAEELTEDSDVCAAVANHLGRQSFQQVSSLVLSDQVSPSATAGVVWQFTPEFLADPPLDTGPFGFNGFRRK